MKTVDIALVLQRALQRPLVTWTAISVDTGIQEIIRHAECPERLPAAYRWWGEELLRRMITGIGQGLLSSDTAMLIARRYHRFGAINREAYLIIRDGLKRLSRLLRSAPVVGAPAPHS